MVTERKMFKAKRRDAGLPPAFLPNDPYAFNPRKRDLEAGENETITKKLETERRHQDEEEGAVFDEGMPMLRLAYPAADDDDEEIIEKMRQVYLG